MANIFKLTQGYAEKPKRNVYDLSFSSNITANFGTLYPVFCKEVNPGDSMKIDTTFALRAQPMIFPIQTRMRADIHYFYVRNRTLWSDWMDFYGKTKEGLIHPYIDRPIGDFKTKSIYDFLGIPTTVMADTSYQDTFSVNPFNFWNTQIPDRNAVVDVLTSSSVDPRVKTPSLSISDRLNRLSNYSPSTPLRFLNDISSGISFFSSVTPLNNYLPSLYTRAAYVLSPISFNSFDYVNGEFISNLVFEFNNPIGTFDSEPFCYVFFFLMKSSESNKLIYDRTIEFSGHSIVGNSTDLSSVPYIAPEVLGSGVLQISGVFYSLPNSISRDKADLLGYDTVLPVLVVSSSYSKISDLFSGALNIGGIYTIYNLKALSSIDSSTLNYLPWCGTNKSLKINALPYRAYEAIYNSFYRNVQNDPFKINGIAEYNKYVTNLSGGADNHPYKLFQRNWELDFLTSAVQSPQQGLAPLVGVTVNNADSTATFKFQSDALNNGQPITATASVSDDGDVVGLQYYDSELPQSNIDRLMQAINYGISINDIRQTNALQRWLEKNIRRGYRYRDQLLSHFGVSVSYNELLMPEFIGGVSQPVETSTVFQTVTNEQGYLGDYAGRASVVGSSRNTVSKYCDEAGFIIGIMSIVPIPVYSQVPSGYAFKSNLMDYYFPEFGKIGMQPIYNYHVTPLQTSPTELSNVFGYQRPWWDLISSVDEVHGEFRTSANGYLIHRQFAETPILNGNFLKIDNDYINDVFAITDVEVSDQFLGLVNFHVTKKTSIPLHGEPSIE